MKESFVKLSNRKQIPFMDVWNTLGLKEHTLYKVLVKAHGGNPEHNSYLFTGFKGYGYVYTHCYEEPRPLSQVYWIRIIKELDSTK